MGFFHERFADEFPGDFGIAGLPHSGWSSSDTGITHVFGGFDFGAASTAIGSGRPRGALGNNRLHDARRRAASVGPAPSAFGAGGFADGDRSGREITAVTS